MKKIAAILKNIKVCTMCSAQLFWSGAEKTINFDTKVAACCWIASDTSSTATTLSPL